jgi:transposase
MQVIYERCAGVDVGKDVIAVAVRLPGGGPVGRGAGKRVYKEFYGCWPRRRGGSSRRA